VRKLVVAHGAVLAALVALTGWGQEDDRQGTREAGFDAHMVKPLEYDALMKLLAGFHKTNS